MACSETSCYTDVYSLSCLLRLVKRSPQFAPKFEISFLAKLDSSNQAIKLFNGQLIYYYKIKLLV